MGMFLSFWITLALFQMFFTRSQQSSGALELENELKQILKTKSSSDLLTQAKCRSFCLHKVYPNETTATCKNETCFECEKACNPGFSSNSQDCRQKCKKEICRQSCDYKYLIDLNMQMVQETKDTVFDLLLPLNLTLFWPESSAFDYYTPVYLVYIKPDDADQGQLLNQVLSTSYSISVATLCGISQKAKSPELEYYFRVIAVNGKDMDESLYISKALEIELKKPQKIVNMKVVTKKPLLYVEDTRLPTKWPGDRVRIPLAWTPHQGDRMFITGYKMTVKDEEDITVADFNLEDDPRHAFFIHEETAKGTNFSISISAMFNCSVGPQRTMQYRYVGCREVDEFPPNKCQIQEKPPQSNPKTRAINKLNVRAPRKALVGSVVVVNLDWEPPAYKHGHVKYYIIEWRVLGINNESLTLKRSFTFSFRMKKPKERIDIKITPKYFNRFITGTAMLHQFSVPYNPQKPTAPDNPQKPTAPDNPQKPTAPGGLTTTAMIGIGVGVGLLVILLVVLLIFLLKRRTKTNTRNSEYDRSLNSMETKLETSEDLIKDEQPKEKMSADNPDANTDPWEVDPNSLRILGELGHGAFGKVFKGILSGWKGHLSTSTSDGSSKSSSSSTGAKEKEIVVAVKTLHKPDDLEQKGEFFDEIAMMKTVGFHRNIVNFMGCCTITEPLCLIQEFVPCGDLLHYLRERRAAILKAKAQGNLYLRPGDLVDTLREDDSKFSTGSSHSNTLLVHSENSAGSVSLKEAVSISSEPPLTAADLMSFAWQISCGMEYISQKGLIHRDLAARNILVGEKKAVKIADFGLTRKINEEHMYVTRKSKKLPIKWMAPEAIFDKVFTTQSDVWAYGVLLWEIATLGGSPYPLILNSNLLQRLKVGYRMERPEHCSDELYAVMKECWQEKPEDRPTFTRIREELEEVMERDTPYLELENMDPKSSYYMAMSGSSTTLDSQEATL